MGLMSNLFGKPAAITQSEMRGPEAWLYDVGGDRTFTSAGVEVGTNNAITLSAVFASARAIAEDVACLPLKAYRRLEGGGKESAADEERWRSPVLNRQVNTYDLVHDEPNPEMTDLTFRSLLLWHAILWGNGYAEIERSGGREVALWPLHPATVQSKRDSNGALYYEVRQRGGANTQPRRIASRDMIHVSGISDDGIVGLMITKYASESLGVYLAAERFTGKFFGNGATLSGVITFDQDFKTPEARKLYIDGFNNLFGGSANSHKWILADSGAKINTISSDPEKSQLVDTLRFRIEDVARWFRVPPVIIGHNTATPYTNIEPLGQMYLKFGLKPWAKRIEKEFKRKLLGDRPEMFIEHVVNALMWADAKTRAEYYNLGIRGGWLLPNESRDFENMNPYPGGDRFRVEQNLAVIDEQGRPEQVNRPAAASDAAQALDVEAAKLHAMPVFVDAAERMIAREVKAFGAKKNPDAAWVDKFYEGHRKEVAAAFVAPIAALSSMAGAVACGLAERYADMHVGESRRRLQEGEQPDTWMTERPAWIARFLTDEVCNG